MARFSTAPAGAGDNAVGDGQAHAGALGLLLGREKGIEDSLQHMRRHSAAGVADRQAYERAGGLQSCGRIPARSMFATGWKKGCLASEDGVVVEDRAVVLPAEAVAIVDGGADECCPPCYF